MARVYLISDFIIEVKSGSGVAVDTRSPAEYEHGHIPGAYNIPLLNNDERKIIGITYKENGREVAVRKGFELVGGKFVDFIDQAKEISPSKNILLYCWRGGMRSSIMAWILNMAGFKVTLLHGGYKQFRRWALEQFEMPRELIVIGGKTGCGKTEILLEIKNYNEQVIDLEALANHKGSAFGGLGKSPQPFQEHFENLLAWELSMTDEKQITWIENESRSIGVRKIPDKIFDRIRTSKLIEIDRGSVIRKNRILSEYGNFSKEQLAEKTKAIAKRLGGLRLKEAIISLEENNLHAWVEIMMEYYDKTYTHSNNSRSGSSILINSSDDENCKMIAEKLLACKKQFSQGAILHQ